MTRDHLVDKLVQARILLICALLVGATLAVFWPITRHGFVAWDDDINVYQNPHLNPASLQSVVFFWKGPYLRLYIPLAYSVWTLAAKVSMHSMGPIAPLSPVPFHAANLLIHLLSGLAAFALLRRILLAAQAPSPDVVRCDWAAGLGALLFVMHPVQVEPVAWVSGLRDVLSGLGALVALEQYVAFSSSTGRKSALHYILATAAFACALLSKPSAVVIPLLAGLVDYGLFRRPLKKIIAPLSAGLLLSLGFSVLTQLVQGATHIRAMVPLWGRPLIAADTTAFYLYKLILPFALSPDYGRAADLVMSKRWCFYTWPAPLLLATAIGLTKERRIWALCAGLSVAAVIPVLGFVPFLHQDLSTVADRYLYLAMVGPAAALAWHLAQRGAGGGRWLLWASVLVLLGVRSRGQTAVWSHTGTLFGHIVALNPESGVAHNNLGNYFADQGKLEEARTHFLETLRLRPGDGLALNNLGSLCARQGKLEEAIRYHTQALANGVPDNVATAHNGLGGILVGQGKLAEAASHYAEAIRINPSRAEAHHNLALLLVRQGKNEEALAHYRWALEAQPNSVETHKNMSVLLAGLGRFEEARLHFAYGLGVSADSMDAYGAVCDSLQVRDQFAQAILCYEGLLRRAPPLAEAYNSLGYALYKLGRVEEAIRRYRQAVGLKPSYKQAQFNLGHTLYLAGRPEETIVVWAKAVETVADSADIHHNLGVLLMQRERRQEAIRHFQAALKLQPNFEPSRQALAEAVRRR